MVTPPAPAGQDGLALVHDVDVIGALIPRQAPAGVFEVFHRVLLPIEVVGVIPRPDKQPRRKGDHLRGRGSCEHLAGVPAERGAALHRGGRAP